MTRPIRIIQLWLEVRADGCLLAPGGGALCAGTDEGSFRDLAGYLYEFLSVSTLTRFLRLILEVDGDAVQGDGVGNDGGGFRSQGRG